MIRLLYCVAVLLGVGLVATSAADKASNDGSPEVKRQIFRTLTVKNDTKEKLTVFVYYRTKTEQAEWIWLPGGPESAKPLAYTLAPGQEAILRDKGKPIMASRVRFWAVNVKSGISWED